MAQCQPRQHDNARGQQRGDDDQQHHPTFTRLHRGDFSFAPAVAPGLEGLHIVIKLTRYRHQTVLQQIVIVIGILRIQGVLHRHDPLSIIGGEARGHFLQQRLTFGIVYPAIDHAFQRGLRLFEFVIDVFHRFCGVIQQPHLHHADSLPRLVARAQDQGVARIKLHQLFALKMVNALQRGGALGEGINADTADEQQQKGHNGQ